MTEYKGLIPEIEIKLKRGGVHKMKIVGSADAAKAFRYFFSEDVIEAYEQVMVIYLDRTNKTIGWYKVSQGGITGTVMDNRLIFSTALKVLACSLIVCHNHPSGNVDPSDADRKVTREMKQIGEFHSIPVLDHIILTDTSFFSFADEGLL